MDKIKEYDYLMQLELETTKIRHTTFTALLSISFILPGITLRSGTDIFIFLGFETNISKIVFLLGFIFYCFAVFHYSWYHRYSHRYRKGLKEIEKELNINVYRRRKRYMKWNFKAHFDWSLYIIGIIYGYVTSLYVGLSLFLIVIGSIIGLYLLFFLLSFFSPIEPHEK